MTKSIECPHCSKPLMPRAVVDSDQRIWSKWLYCYPCNYDSRKDNPNAGQSK